MATGAPKKNIVEPMKTSHGLVWARTDKVPYRNKNGEIIGIIGFTIDITDLKEKDRAIRQAYTDIFQAVTGGKLVLTTLDELNASLRVPVCDPFYLSTYADLPAVRSRTQEILVSSFPSLKNPEDLLLIANEALTNAIKHSGYGRFRIYRSGDAIQMEICDSGPGIDFKTLPRAALMPGYSTMGSLGMGFKIMLELSDRLLLSTEPGNTTLVLEVKP
jgi:anti-sigma regulatory factor (Ser/Thr protein kinase)